MRLLMLIKNSRDLFGFLLVLGLLLIPSKANAQSTATYGTLVTSLDTTSTGAVNGTIFAVPSSYAALIQWTVVADGSALSVALQCSLDNVSYFTVDTITTATGGTRQFGFTACKFVRINAVSRTGGTSSIGTLVTSRGFITSSSAGSLSSLNLTGALNINQGTITTDQQAISSTATWNNAGVAFKHWRAVITDTASAAGSLPIEILGGAAGTTNLLSVSKTGILTTGSSIVSGVDVSVPAGRLFNWVTRSIMQSPSDGVILFSNNAITDFSRLQFGGTTSSFPALKRVTTGLEVRLADDSSGAPFTASNVIATGQFMIGSGSVRVISAVAPTIPVACTTPTVTWSNGTASFQIDVGSSCTGITTLSFTMPSASNGWSCDARNLSNSATSTPWQSAGTPTSVTFTNYARTTGLAADWTAGDDIRVSCLGG